MNYLCSKNSTLYFCMDTILFSIFLHYIKNKNNSFMATS